MTDTDPDDALLDALVEHARARRREDDAHAARLDADLDDPGPSDVDRDARHRPYTAAEDDALLAAALAAVAHPNSTSTAPLADITRPTPPRRALTFAPLAATAIALIIAALWLWPSAAPELPTYRLEDHSGDRLVRDDSARVLRPGARLRLVLRPATRTELPIAAAAWTLDPDGPHPLPLPFEAAPGGALRVDTPLDTALPGRTGPVTLTIAIGPPDVLATLDPTTPPDTVRTLNHRLDIRPAP